MKPHTLAIGLLMAMLMLWDTVEGSLVASPLALAAFAVSAVVDAVRAHAPPRKDPVVTVKLGDEEIRRVVAETLQAEIPQDAGKGSKQNA